jgi:AcrR family transcriptional regulator
MVRQNVIFADFKNQGMTESILEKTGKVQMIVGAAQKRFGLFGIEKTSMQEIANDLGLSKASLYYYFPDKESLYIAVVEKEQTEFLEKIRERLRNKKEPDSILREYAQIRLSYFRTLLNLSRLRYEHYSDLKPVFRDSITAFREKEKEIIISIFNHGIEKKVFEINDTEKTASLFLDLLKGLRVSVVNDKVTMFIDQDEFDRLLEKTNSFAEIFIRGLMYGKNK